MFLLPNSYQWTLTLLLCFLLPGWCIDKCESGCFKIFACGLAVGVTPSFALFMFPSSSPTSMAKTIGDLVFSVEVQLCGKAPIWGTFFLNVSLPVIQKTTHLYTARDGADKWLDLSETNSSAWYKNPGWKSFIPSFLDNMYPRVSVRFLERLFSYCITGM